MRILVQVARVFVGVLFIISGLVKANDPLGLGYKMQEFFEVWNDSLVSSSFFAKGALISSFHFFHEHSLALSVIMITLEIVAGVALLIGWKRRAVVTGLLVLIIFFTFLTAYAFLSGKFKTCGCFGDCLPIPPLASFLKDILLLVLVIFLLIYRRYITPLFSSRSSAFALTLSLVLTLIMQFYMLRYLPVVDCLPYAKGKNIAEQMKIPANAVQDSFAMKFIYEKEGKKYEFSPEQFPSDLATYKFVDRQQKLVRKGNATAPITGFMLQTLDGTDYTNPVLYEPKIVLVMALDFDDLNNWMSAFKKLYVEAKKKGTPLYVVSPAAAQGKIIFNSFGLTDVEFLTCDNTAVRTAARVDPTIYILEKGIVVEKTSGRRIEKAINKL